MIPTLTVDTREARGQLRRGGRLVREHSPALINEAAARAAAEAYETTREAHREDIERSLNKIVTMAAGEEMPMGEAIVLKQHPGIGQAARQKQAVKLKRARLGARGFVRMGFKWALRDLNRVIRKPIKTRSDVRMGTMPKGHAIPAKPGADPIATIVNDIALHGPGAATMDSDREAALRNAITREERSLPGSLGKLLRWAFR